MRSWRRIAAAIMCLAAAPSVSAQVRVGFYNIAGLQGSQPAIADVIATIHDDDTPGFATPADVLVFCEVRQSSIAGLTALVSSAAPPGVSYSLGTFTTSGSEDSAGGANAIYLRNGRVSEIVSGHKDIFTGAGRNADRWLVQLSGYSSPQSKIYLYGAHLKASPGSANEALRLSGVQAIRADADQLPAGTPIIYSGDMNFYSSSESGYQFWVGSAGNGIAFDELPGSWNGSGNALKHTQSPRAVSRGLVGGGMDDRFDFQLFSETVVDDAGIAVIPGTYRALGNDGLHYQKAINNGNNFYFPGDVSRSNTLANALFDASDHIPVVVDLQQPAVSEAWIAVQPGRVIRNASVAVEMRVWNAVTVAAPIGVDPLDFTANGTGQVGGAASGTAPVQPNAGSYFFPINTSVVGNITGTVTVSSSNEAVQNPLLSLPVTGKIVRKANASFSGATDLNTTTASFQVTSGTGVVELLVPVFNFGFDANQALLDVDATVLGPGSAPFSVIQGSALGIGATPATLRFGFDTTGVGAGVVTRSATVTCTDENIPGEDVSFLTLTLSVTVGAATPGDLNGDGLVNGADLAIVLGQWGTSGSADIDGNGTVDGADVAIVLGFWS